MALPKVAPDPGQKLTTPSGMPASSSNSTNFAAMVGESLDGFRITVFPETIGSHRHASHDGAGKIPRRNHGAHSERNVVQRIALAGQLDVGLDFGEAQSFTSVDIRQEIDGLGDVGVGLGPVLADFKYQPGGKFKFAFAQ